MAGKAALSPERGKAIHMLSDDNAPVALLFWGYPKTAIPGVWVTEPVREPTLERTGRVCIGRYPGVSDKRFGPFTEDDLLGYEFSDDEDGYEAIRLGAEYCEQGMNIQDPMFRRDRIDCFRAAEALGLWAAGKGNVQAFVNLGYIYCYDLCEGEYVGADENGNAFGFDEIEMRYNVDCDARAYQCYAKAAEAGHPQAIYKLGDLTNSGRGCKVDKIRALVLWRRAYKEAQKYDTPLWWGAAALRLGSAYENGDDDWPSLHLARFWYSRAVAGLQVAVDEGNWFYEESLARAIAGKARCEQELL